MKKVRLLILLVFICTILTACTDSVEIDDEVYTLALGIDKGANNNMRVTVQCPTYKGSGGNSGGQQGGGGASKDEDGEVDNTIISSVEASGILEAMNLLNASIPRRISLTHCKMLVLSEEIAKEGVEKFVAPITRFRETRRIMRVIVCNGKSEDFLKENKSLFGQSTAKAIELMFKQARINEYFPDVTLNDFYNALVSPYEQPYAIYGGINEFKALPEEAGRGKSPLVTEPDISPGNVPRKGAAKRELFGTAVFNESKMVGSLNSYETRCLLMVLGKFHSGIFNFEDMNKPGYAIGINLREGRAPVIKAHFKDGVPVIDVKINLEGDIVGIQSRINYEDLGNINQLNSYLENHFQKRIMDLVEKTQQNWNSDIFGFGEKVAGLFSTIEEWEEYQWLEHYKEAKINIKVVANVRRTGMIFRSAPIKGM